MIDRTDDFNSAVDRLVKQLPQHEALRVRSSVMLKKAHPVSAFKGAALNVISNIGLLRDFIKANQRDFCTPGSISDAECNVIESEVGMLIKAATQQIDQLKASVLAAQQQPSRPQPEGATKSTSKLLPSPPSAKPVHPQVVAHLHGVVLIAAERLHAVSCMFDKCRSIRYQQLALRKPRQRPSTAAAAASPAMHRGNGMDVSIRHPEPTHFGDGPAAQVQAQDMQEENQSLLAQLVRTGQAVSGVEQSMLEVSTLFQVFSSAVHSQAEAIEHIYDAACEATHFVAAGNESLVKTIAVNRSSQRYLLVLLLVATLCLLLFDWMNS